MKVILELSALSFEEVMTLAKKAVCEHETAAVLPIVLAWAEKNNEELQQYRAMHEREASRKPGKKGKRYDA